MIITVSLFIFSKTCNSTRERTFILLSFILLLISSLSILIHYSKAAPLFEDYRSTDVRGEEFTFFVIVEAPEPVNVFAGKLQYDPTQLLVTHVDTKKSIADLWVESPQINNEKGFISYSGGTTKKGGFTGKNVLFSVTAKPLASDAVNIELSEQTLYRSDGRGTKISLEPLNSTVVLNTTTNNIKPEAELPTDLNGDGKNNFNDFGVYLEYASHNDERGDLNNDQKIDSTDFNLLRSNI